MLGYLDPKHPYRALREAQKIIEAADSNGDGMLRVEEFIKVIDWILILAYISYLRFLQTNSEYMYRLIFR